jgi:HlyD family secretion protein
VNQSSPFRVFFNRAGLPALALVCLAGLVAGCKKPDEAPTPEVSVQAEKVAQGPLTEYVSGETVLSPLSEAAIVPKISAPVQRFLVDRGAHVRKGQLLAVLDNGDLAAAVQDAQGGLTQADAGYATTTKASVPEDQQKAQLDVTQAKTNLDAQQSIFDSRKKLLQEGAIPRRDFESATTALVQAQAAYNTAELHLKSMNAVSRAATVKTAQGALESARGKYEGARASLGYSEIRSPIDGVVTDRPLFVGEMANAGQAIITVMDTSSLVAKLHFTPEQALKMKVGNVAKALISGVDEPVEGVVSLISPAVDAGSTTLEVRVTLPNKSGALKAGSSVHMSVAGRTLASVLTAPNEALIKTSSGTFAVMVVAADNIAHQKIVKTGITDGKDTQIVSGVQAGDEVVTAGAYGMDDGTKVKIAVPGSDDASADDAKPSAAAKGDQ